MVGSDVASMRGCVWCAVVLFKVVAGRLPFLEDGSVLGVHVGEDEIVEFAGYKASVQGES